jgi:RTX calcium-binding nonapeptide repeat (4 copies)
MISATINKWRVGAFSLAGVVASLSVAGWPTPAAPVTAAVAAEPSAQVFVANNKLNVVAALGFTNDVRVSLAGTAYTVHDPANVLAPGIGGCVAVDSNTVTCPLAGAPSIEVLTSDLNDTVTITANRAVVADLGIGADRIVLNQTSTRLVNTLRGGPGNDELFGGLGRDTVFGGAGLDRIDGGGGADTMLGESDDDTLSDGDLLLPDSADSFSGGTGRDACFGVNSFDPKFGEDVFISCENI